jgi:hypothetical protein
MLSAAARFSVIAFTITSGFRSPVSGFELLFLQEERASKLRDKNSIVGFILDRLFITLKTTNDKAL